MRLAKMVRPDWNGDPYNDVHFCIYHSNEWMYYCELGYLTHSVTEV